MPAVLPHSFRRLLRFMDSLQAQIILLIFPDALMGGVLRSMQNQVGLGFLGLRLRLYVLWWLCI